jgi:hypothetical protein
MRTKTVWLAQSGSFLFFSFFCSPAWTRGSFCKYLPSDKDMMKRYRAVCGLKIGHKYRGKGTYGRQAMGTQ